MLSDFRRCRATEGVFHMFEVLRLQRYFLRRASIQCSVGAGDNFCNREFRFRRGSLCKLLPVICAVLDQPLVGVKLFLRRHDFPYW